VAGGWRRQHNEELHNLYASENIVRVTRSTKIRCAVPVAFTGEMTHIIFCLENLK
jgi:hypothetical protein